MYFKFFPRDIVRGHANKPGDVFAARLLSGVCSFRVVEHHGTFFIAELVS